MTTVPLTIHDVRALRKATDLCFDHNSAVEATSQARIRAIWGGKGGPRPEQTYVVPVEGNRVSNYGPVIGGFGGWDCFHMAMNCQHMEHMRTLVHFIKTGDRLGFHWVRGNSSPVLDKADVVRDEFYIEVIREKPHTKAAVHTFLVHISVSLDNTARMVRVR